MQINYKIKLNICSVSLSVSRTSISHDSHSESHMILDHGPRFYTSFNNDYGLVSNAIYNNRLHFHSDLWHCQYAGKATRQQP